ncbi:MAG TPA: NUDIX domain-containing protein [Candidatus Aenigmarchaeota archaeon]|nr:NUDIX domain-containing protein [Candidatus Aenigmarchaeota archaeon]
MELRVVTANIIEKKGKILLVQEGHKYAYGLWNFPAGKLEEQISLVDNAVKEAKEESGYNVKVKGVVGIYHHMSKDKNVVVIVFASYMVSGELRKSSDKEILQAKWFTYDEIKKMKNTLRGSYILTAIGDYKKKGFLPISTVKSLHV